MAIKLTELAVKLEAQGASDVKAAMDGIGNKARDLGKNLSGILSPANALKSVLGGLGATLAAGAVGAFFKGALDEAGKAQQAMTLLQAATDNAGGNFARLKPQFEAAADGIAKFTRFSDDEAVAALTKMVAVTGDTAGSLKNLGLAADLAVFKGKTLEESAELIGRAMNGNLGPLKKMGVDLRDGGDAMDQLSKKIGGFAEKDAKTFPGQLKLISNAWGEVKEAIGKAILGMDGASSGGEIVVKALQKLQTWVTSNAAAIAGFVKWVFKLGKQFIDLGADIWKMVQQARVAMVKLNGYFLEFDQNAKRMFGSIVSGLATVFEKITAPLRALGVTIADGLVGKLRSAGDSMQADAIRATAQIRDDTKRKIAAIMGTAAAAKDAINDVADAGGHSSPGRRTGGRAKGKGKTDERYGATGTGPTVGAARPGNPSSQPMSNVPESMVVPIDQGANEELNKQQIKIGEAVGDFADKLEQDIDQTVGDAIYNGFARAFSGEGIAGLFKGLASTVLSGLGSIFVDMGRKMIAGSAIMLAFKTALLGFLPPAGFVAGAAMIALGAGMGAAGNAVGGGGRSVTSGYASSSSSRSIGEEITRFKFIDRFGSRVVNPRSSTTHNWTVIGVNDPVAQRHIMELIANAERRKG
ncbi:MAG: hypothetical protein M3O61_03360 [Gemmatimonadota bacterium]|nr:hypothetical protein [Gemmatimonadota bacterium]